jgi:hypothetical protein
MKPSSLVGALVVGLALSVPLPGHTPTASAATECASASRSDFDGDGLPDVVVADPDATVDDAGGAGRVVVSYGTAPDTPGGGRTAVVSQDTAGVGGAPERGDHFGAALSVADVDCDEYTDLVVGVPGEDVGDLSDSGLVQVLWGGPDGLGGGRASRELDQPTFGLRRHAGDQLGAAVDAQEHVSYDETQTVGGLLVGVPGYDVGGRRDAGLVAYEAPDEAQGSVRSWFTQNSRGVPGEAETGDRFGSVVALAFPAGDEGVLGAFVGVPREDVGPAADAGAVTFVKGLQQGSLTGVGLDQDTPGVPGAVEAGDRFGASLAATFDGTDVELAVGVPGEDLGSTTDAGTVQRFSYDSEDFTASPSLSQDTAGVGDVAEAGDAFGSQVALTGASGSGTVLAVGSPGEDGSAVDTGLVQVFGTRQATYTQESLGVGDRSEAHDRFGSVLGTIGDEADLLLAGVPDDAQHADGVVELVVLDGARRARHLVPGSGGVPSAGADRFGAAVGTYHGG